MTDTIPEIKNKLDLSDDKWALVRLPQGSYLAVVREYAKHEGSALLTLNPVFDYFTSIQATPEGKLQKQAICLPFDTTLDHVDVNVVASVVTIVWFKDMSKEDRKRYEALVQQADGLARTSRSGIELGANGPRR